MKYVQKLPWASGLPAVGQPVLVPVPRLACRWKQLSSHCLLVMASLLPSLPDCAWKLLWRSTSSANTGIREQFRVETNGPVLRNLLALTRIDEHWLTDMLCMQSGEERSNVDCYRLFVIWCNAAHCPAKEKNPGPEELARWGRGGKQRLSDGKCLAKAAEPARSSAVTSTHLQEGEPAAGSWWCCWPGWHPASHPSQAEGCREALPSPCRIHLRAGRQVIKAS